MKAVIFIGLYDEIPDVPPVSLRIRQLLVCVFRHSRQSETFLSIVPSRERRCVCVPQRVFAREPYLVRGNRLLTRFRRNPAVRRRVHVNVNLHRIRIRMVQCDGDSAVFNAFRMELSDSVTSVI